MKFSVHQSDLYRAMRDVGRALPVKSEKTILENIHMIVNEDGLTLAASDGNMTIITTAPAEVEDGGRLLVPGKLFSDMVNKLTSDQVVFQVDSKYNMRVSCGKMKANIGCSDADYPETQDLSNVAPFHLEKNVLADMIEKVSFAVSVQDSRPLLTGVCLELTADELRLVALDGFRLALQVRHENYILPENCEHISAVIPGKVINTLKDIMAASGENAVTLRLSKENMSARIGGTELVSALMAGEFIKYRQLLPTDFLTRLKINRSSLQGAVERAAIFANDGKTNLIKLSASKEGLIVASNSEFGADVEELDDVELTGEELTIAFNTKYLSDVFRHVEDETLMMCMNTNVSPCVIKPESGDKYLYLILPVRVYA